MVVGGDDEEPGAEVEGDDHAPQVPPRGDARHGADGGHHVEHLKEIKKAVRSSCDFLLHLPRLDLAVIFIRSHLSCDPRERQGNDSERDDFDRHLLI